jgi:uncharacterized protein (TIGR03435 family)
VATLLLIGAFLVVPASISAPPQETLARFEAASVKPNRSGLEAQSSHITPGRLTVENMTLQNIVKSAYRIHQDQQLHGGPNWINSERFDIVATAGENVDREQIFVMLQTLLADRFKMTVHKESVEESVYLLLPAKNGPKVQESVEYKAPKPNPDTQFFTARGTASAFATLLSKLLGRTVVDKTGLTGNHYDFTLEIHREEGVTIVGGPVNTSMAASVVAALAPQLGLKLESSKANVDAIVIDHVERPSEN